MWSKVCLSCLRESNALSIAWFDVWRAWPSVVAGCAVGPSEVGLGQQGRRLNRGGMQSLAGVFPGFEYSKPFSASRKGSERGRTYLADANPCEPRQQVAECVVGALALCSRQIEQILTQHFVYYRSHNLISVILESLKRSQLSACVSLMY